MSLTVRELIDRLTQLGQDEALVILSKDQEGNEFSPLWEVLPGEYEPDSPYSGQFFADGDPDYLVAPRPAIALWPTN